MIRIPLHRPPVPTASVFRRLQRNLSNSLRPKTPEDKVLFWSGFMYVPSAVLTPLMTRWQLQHANTPQYEQNLMVRSEVVRQTIGALAHFVGFFGGMAISGLGGAKGAKPKTLQKLVGSVAGATLSYAFLRPLALNAYMAQWVKRHRQPQPPTSSSAVPQHRSRAASLAAHPPIQATMTGYPARPVNPPQNPYQQKLQPILNRLA